jgi:pimeloyl-ACP methyl ester carboxylesterase
VTFVTSGELRLWSESSGDPDDPAILLIADAQSQSLAWPSALVEKLVAGGFRVLRYDHRDTGQSDSVDFDGAPYALEDLALDALAVLDGNDVAAAHLIGASTGGMIAQWLAVHRPSRVLSLTLFNTTPMAPAADLPPPAAAMLARFAEPVPRATTAQRVAADIEIYRGLNGDGVPFDDAAARDLATGSYARARDWTAAANHSRALKVVGDDRRAPLASIAVPTLVIQGRQDPLYALPHGAALAAQIPGARLVELDAMGHGLLSPGLPDRIADLILQNAAPAGAAA